MHGGPMRTVIVVLLLGALYLQYALWFTRGGIRDVDKLEAAVREAKDDIAQLRERNRGLAAEVMDLKQGLEAIEERARSEMGKIKSDEVFFRMTEPPLNPPVAGSPPAVELQAAEAPTIDGAAEGIPAADLAPVVVPPEAAASVPEAPVHGGVVPAPEARP